ncbi:putative lipoprotein [Escherichia coli DEC8A]|nr:putative lipoprotein [Escherichia coli DEC8A]
MKNTKLLLAIATSAALLTGCQNTHGIDTNMAISSGLNAYKALMNPLMIFIKIIKLR